jgi:hypothetical protein
VFRLPAIAVTRDTAWSITYLRQNTSYYFGVRAVDSIGNIDSNNVILSSKLPMLSDLNGDAKVGAADLLIFKNAWMSNDTLVGDIGPAVGTPPDWQPVRDHKVDFDDVMVLAFGWKYSVKHPLIPFRLNKSGDPDSARPIVVSGNDVIVRPMEKRPVRLGLCIEKEMAAVELSLSFDTSKVMIDSVTFPDANTLLQFTDINASSGTCSIALVSLSDSLYRYVDTHGGLTVWVTAKQKLVEEQIVLRASLYDHSAGLIRSTDQQVTLNWRQRVPDVYTLAQNYPNPFNPATTLEYQLPVDTKVSLKVYNVLGQEVAEIVNDLQKAGYYTAVWNASSFATGVYIYRLATKDFVQTKKMLLLK